MVLKTPKHATILSYNNLAQQHNGHHGISCAYSVYHVLHDEAAHILQLDVDLRVLEFLPPRFFILEPEDHQRNGARQACGFGRTHGAR